MQENNIFSNTNLSPSNRQKPKIPALNWAYSNPPFQPPANTEARTIPGNTVKGISRFTVPANVYNIRYTLYINFYITCMFLCEDELIFPAFAINIWLLCPSLDKPRFRMPLQDHILLRPIKP